MRNGLSMIKIDFHKTNFDGHTSNKNIKKRLIFMDREILLGLKRIFIFNF